MTNQTRWILTAMRKRRDHLRRLSRECRHRATFSPVRNDADRAFDMRLAEVWMRQAWQIHQNLRTFKCNAI